MIFPVSFNELLFNVTCNKLTEMKSVNDFLCIYDEKIVRSTHFRLWRLFELTSSDKDLHSKLMRLEIKE